MALMAQAVPGNGELWPKMSCSSPGATKAADGTKDPASRETNDLSPGARDTWAGLEISGQRTFGQRGHCS